MRSFLVCLIFSLFLLDLCTSYPSKKDSPPEFKDVYFAQGILKLPYAEINEPFTAYYDKPNKRSRVDYYGDLVQTIQRADQGEDGHGVSYKVAYMPSETDGRPVHTCFAVNGSEIQPVNIQSVVPDLTGFTLVRSEPCPGATSQGAICELWERTIQNEQKVNRYAMWLEETDDGPIPRYYLMKGYDSLFGSHYDKYEVLYLQYYTGNFSEDVFSVDKSLTCRSFPGPGAERLALLNPMHEFIDNCDDHIVSAFEDFKTKHGKNYSDTTDHERRKNIFRQNYRFIHSTNRASSKYQLAVNHLTDYTDEEMRILRGRLPSRGYNGGQPFLKENYSKKIPDSMDWRLYGAVTPVKDQAVCGSCWSFGTTGTIEGAYFLKTGKLVKLSEQQLIDCSWNSQNNGCDGGEDFRAYQYIKQAGGLASTEDYGAYIGQDGLCHDQTTPKTVQVVDYVNVTSGDADALRLAIFHHGPISVSIDASHKTFSFYSNGVYYESACGSDPDSLDHSVLAVGYGVLNGEPYWLVKNSWSTYWGNDGYVLMSQKDNNCGVATAPTFVRL